MLQAEDCQICLEPVLAGEAVRHCEGGRHVFCRTCFDEWCLTTAQGGGNTYFCYCPVCRSQIHLYQERMQYYPSGKILSIYGFVNGKFHGRSRIWYDSGGLYQECFYENDQLNGPNQTYHRSGGIDEKCHYVEGKRHGVFEKWYPGGQRKVVCHYEEDVLHGLYQEWHSSGEILKECHYEEGVGTVRTWYPNGVLHEEYLEKDRVWNGPYQSWHPNGKPASRGTYRKGIREGGFCDWTPQGVCIENFYVEEGLVLEGLLDKILSDDWLTSA